MTHNGILICVGRSINTELLENMNPASYSFDI